MGLEKGTMTLRRYQVLGAAPNDPVSAYRDKLVERSFRDPENNSSADEKVGWTTTFSLLDTDFGPEQRWFLEPYIFASMRVDKKTLPSNLFRAKLKHRLAQYCEENDVKRVPRGERERIKDGLEFSMLAQTLPKVRTVEFCWNIAQGYVIFLSTSSYLNELFQVLFYETFALQLQPFNPLLLLDGSGNGESDANEVIQELRHGLMSCGHSNFQVYPQSM